MSNNKFQDLTGQNFGRLNVLERVYVGGNARHMWKCICEKEGNIVLVRAGDLNKGTILSCGCYGIEKKKKEYYKGTKDIIGSRWCTIRDSAKKRGINLCISIEDAQKKFDEQKKLCYFTGEALTHPQFHGDYTYTASLDRLDSNLDYTYNNVVWVSKDINIIKQTCNEQEFLDWCKQIYLYQNGLYIPEKREIIIHEYSKNYKGIGNLSQSFYFTIERGAILRNIVFNLSKEELWNKYLEQNGICAISGVNIDINSNYSKFRKLQTASLDRINNSLGYTLDNVNWIHKTLNPMKNIYSMNKFISLITKVYLYQGNR